jgi:lysine 2,3-aminomutase
MERWQDILKESVTTVDELVERFGEANIDREQVQQAIDKFNLRLTPAVLARIQKPGDSFWTQYVPTPAENEVVDGIVDSLDEDADSPVPNITHRYPDRVLFLVSPVCASYCRFCTRRRKVGDPEKIPLNQFDSAFAYLREHTEVRDVILSGGDPFEPPAAADHAGAVRHRAQASSGLHQRALQPPGRADTGGDARTRHARRLRRTARLPDRVAQGRER